MHILLIYRHHVLSRWSNNVRVYGAYALCFGRQDVVVITVTYALATVLIYNNPQCTSRDLKRSKVTV